MLYSIDIEKGQHLLDDQGLFATKFRTIRKIIIPIFWEDSFDYTVIVPDPSCLQTYILKADKKFPMPIIETIQQWVESQNGAQLIFCKEPAKSLRLVDSGPIMLANIKLEAFNQPPLNEKDIAQILPTLKYRILSEMIAEQVDVEERDLKMLLSNPRFKDSLSDVNPYTHSLQEDSFIGGTARERHPDTSSLSEIPILSTPSPK